MGRTAAITLAIGCTWLGRIDRARAMDTEVTATTAAQGYDVASPFGDPSVTRRRFIQTLGLSVYRIGADSTFKPGDPEFFVKLRLRLDADFGIESAETTYGLSSTRFVPGLELAPVDLMYGYLEGRNLLHGLLGFRLGRQYTSDALGWWAFDGGLVRVTTPFFVEFEAYGGSEERGGMPLSTPRFEQQGVWRGDRVGIDLAKYPDFMQSALAPAYGFAVESAGLTFVHLRADYRKVLNTGSVPLEGNLPVDASLPTYDATRTSSERVGAAVEASTMKVGGVEGGFVYDIFNGFVSSWYAAANWFGPAGITAGIDYDYFRPTFDGDSIFNFFAHNPMDTMTARVAYDSPFGFSATASGGLRRYHTAGDPTTYDQTGALGDTTENDVLGSLGGRYRWGSGSIDLHGMIDRGDRGRREGGDLSGEKSFLNGRWLALARLSLFDWQDALRPDRGATSFGYVLGGGFRPSTSTDLRIEWEHETNRLVGQRYRVVALLNLAVMP